MSSHFLRPGFCAAPFVGGVTIFFHPIHMEWRHPVNRCSFCEVIKATSMQRSWTVRPQCGDEQKSAWSTKLPNSSSSPPHVVEGHTARKWFLQNIPLTEICGRPYNWTWALFFSLASQLDWGIMRDNGELTCLPCTEWRFSCSTCYGLSSCSPHRNIPEEQRQKCFIASLKAPSIVFICK